jgi:biopolymer transport protein ExbD
MIKYIFTMITALFLTGCATIATQGKMDVVKIDSDGATYLNGVRTPVASLSESFERPELVIESDRSAPFDSIKLVLEEAREAGVPTVSMKTKGAPE